MFGKGLAKYSLHKEIVPWYWCLCYFSSIFLCSKIPNGLEKWFHEMSMLSKHEVFWFKSQPQKEMIKMNDTLILLTPKLSADYINLKSPWVAQERKKGKLLVADDKTLYLKDLECSIRKLLQHVNTFLYNITIQNQQLVRDLQTWQKRNKQKSHGSFKKMKYIRINPSWKDGKIFYKEEFLKCWEKRLKENTRRWKDLLCSRILAKQKYCIKQFTNE